MTGSEHSISVKTGRHWGRDITPPEPAVTTAKKDSHELPLGSLARASIANVLAEFESCERLWPRHARHIPPARRILERLAELPGETWRDRWLLYESETGTDALSWRLPFSDAQTVRERISAAMGPLQALDVVRPSYPWLFRQKVGYLAAVSTFRDPSATATYEKALLEHGLGDEQRRAAVQLAARVQIRTGKSIRQITAEDILEVTTSLVGRSVNFSRNGLNAAWPTLHRLGWIEHESTAMPSRRRVGQRGVEELVDRYGLPEPLRTPVVRYLEIRAAALDYSSLRGLTRDLVKLFLIDVLEQSPGQSTFVLTSEQARSWKERVRKKDDGRDRRGWHAVFFRVRAFYLDVGQWALEDSYWAQWAAPCPIAFEETRGYSKSKRAQVAEQHQRTRELAPVLPRLVAAAERELRLAEGTLAAAHAAGHGGKVELEGRSWVIHRRAPDAPVRARLDDRERNLTQEEDEAFWTWAIVETLRHSGVRIEELLEIVHMSIQPYKVPATGETVPLLHIAPSKTDQERLLVAGPELVHVLYRVLHRAMGGSGAVPLTQRWDHTEKVLGSPLPHLFVRSQTGPSSRVISVSTVSRLLNVLASKAGIKVGGREVRYTPHDFRRIFATEALASGLPPHIVQVLMGHQHVSTTQGYAAIYPQDVIRHHRTFIAQRRESRPTEEYREPTPAEWDEFEAHFVQRKLELGSCGRAFGTACHHEHACLRCALLRPDPEQIDRLRAIIANLADRIEEAQDHGWHGDVEGLRVTVSGAELKLRQMETQIARGDEPVVLGLPTLGPPR